MPGTKPQILCLDDRPDNLRIRKMLLERFGCDVVTVSEAQECLRIATSVKFDLILLDYHLGSSINGEDIANDLRSCTPDVPLIMLSGDPNIPESAKRSVDAVLIKGQSNPGDLLRTIQLLLPGYDLRAQHRTMVSTVFSDDGYKKNDPEQPRKPSRAENQKSAPPPPLLFRQKS